MTPLDERIIGEIHELSSRLSQASNGSHGPAHFWESLCKKHTDLVAQYGFNKFKRTINFEYNQWGVQSYKDYKIKNLVKQLLLRGRLPVGIVKAKINPNDATDIRWPDSIDHGTGETLKNIPSSTRSNRMNYRLSAYAAYVGMLWQYARLDDSLACLERSYEPVVGDPIPVTYGGKLISQDLALSALELNKIARHIRMKDTMTIGEIGAGYGRLAYLTAQIFTKCRYFIFDIPPALAISTNYLSQVLGPENILASYGKETSPWLSTRQVTTCLPHELEQFPNDYFDLIINVSSFDEMSPAQVETYLDLVDKKCRGFLYVKGFAKTVSPGLRLGVDEFPYRPHWVKRYEGQDPIIPSFKEKIFQVHPA